ncbi:uncharacterized protein GGS22DRAFT_198881 [Annulohypoxylon maeteangense]|uniref:uncharacterized protein n=1 Tax=Annulohypoxylon maeteangense TaxID=1927788 RepID=UPI002007936F|nr:uncharacterized protein GGS22DRAFT_198881 [Annulohypoxylon maeteangense]KAI0879779.1 hypothetical protein GGS22DRAFT_198881 [Annulohypoxylon maeteangense]
MSWTQQGAHWHRPLDSLDRFYQFVSAAGKPLNREHWLLVGVIRLEFPIGVDGGETRLRSAWKALRFRHPDIALELLENEKRYEPITSTEALETWADSTFYIETAVSSADEHFSLNLKTGTASATCHWIPASGEVAIVSSHWRWDGRGLMMMMHEFLLCLGGQSSQPAPLSGTEARKLVPTLDLLVGTPVEGTDKEWPGLVDKLLAPLNEGSPSIGLPIIPDALPGNTRRIEAIIPRKGTAALLTACRDRHIRLTAALHASVVSETARYQQSTSSATARYKSWAVFDLRKYCPTPFDGPLHAPSLRTIALPLSVDAKADWDTLAASIHSIYQQSFAPGRNSLMYLRVPYLEKATEILATAAPTTEPNLSNLGVMDDYVRKNYGDVTVRDAWLAVQMLSRQLYVHTWSWDGELHLSISYNEAFYQADFVEKWLERLKNTLLTKLPGEDVVSSEGSISVT